MTKKKIEVEWGSVDYESLESIIQTADNIIGSHPEVTYRDINLSSEIYYDSHRTMLSYYRDETEVETAQRLEREEKSRLWNEKRDREQFEALKKKFGETK